MHPRDPELARTIAAHAGATLEQLGLVAPSPAPPPPEPPRPPVDVLVDSVVCAAAEAMSLTPGDVRAGLHAAFARANVMGLTAGEVEGVLRPKPPTRASRTSPSSRRRRA